MHTSARVYGVGWGVVAECVGLEQGCSFCWQEGWQPGTVTLCGASYCLLTAVLLLLQLVGSKDGLPTWVCEFMVTRPTIDDTIQVCPCTRCQRLPYDLT